MPYIKYGVCATITNMPNYIASNKYKADCIFSFFSSHSPTIRLKITNMKSVMKFSLNLSFRNWFRMIFRFLNLFAGLLT